MAKLISTCDDCDGTGEEWYSDASGIGLCRCCDGRGIVGPIEFSELSAQARQDFANSVIVRARRYGALPRHVVSCCDSDRMWEWIEEQWYEQVADRNGKAVQL